MTKHPVPNILAWEVPVTLVIEAETAEGAYREAARVLRPEVENVPPSSGGAPVGIVSFVLPASPNRLRTMGELSLPETVVNAAGERVEVEW